MTGVFEMTWFEVIKIRDEKGDFLKVTDYYRFIDMLKIALRAKVAPYREIDLLPSGKPKPGVRRSYVNVNRKKGVQMGDMLTFKVSGLNASTANRYQYEFTLKEDEGDLLFMSVTGPDINYQRDTVIPNEFSIIESIAEVIGRIHEDKPRVSTGANVVMDEMQEEHEERELDIKDFSDREARMRREAEEKDDESKTPEGQEPGKSWWQRFKRWKGKSD